MITVLILRLYARCRAYKTAPYATITIDLKRKAGHFFPIGVMCELICATEARMSHAYSNYFAGMYDYCLSWHIYIDLHSMMMV